MPRAWPYCVRSHVRAWTFCERSHVRAWTSYLRSRVRACVAVLRAFSHAFVAVLRAFSRACVDVFIRAHVLACELERLLLKPSHSLFFLRLLAYSRRVCRYSMFWPVLLSSKLYQTSAFSWIGWICRLIAYVMDMSIQVSRMCQSAYFQLHNIAKIRHCLTVNACKTIVHALVFRNIKAGLQ